jgi:superfamily II DNA or RNA helicase
MSNSSTILRDYQIAAIDKWKQNSFQGLFEMATGTGKTITALNCAKYLLDTEGKINLIILVPTIDLAIQWKDEVNKHLLKKIILANSKNKNWYTEALAALNGDGNYCIIATYATFLTNRFSSFISKVSEKTMIIADEAHNFGTERHYPLYPNHILRRLGLSATPDRYFDDEGTKRIFNYFGLIKNLPTFTFSMADAISQNYLCEYYYYPVVVNLNDEELNEYKEISLKLLKYFNDKTLSFKESTVLTTLLLKRKKIIHNAAGKFEAFRKILTEIHYKNKLAKYILVYVPEGNDNKIDDDDKKLINSYSKIVSDEFHFSQHQFIGLTTNRQKILNDFSTGKISVLTAMKCLDEGVDIKRAETAIFCSSSGNPRQFIQRRGRILRTHPDKKYAVIYDLIVMPTLNKLYFEDSLGMEQNIIQSELKRIHEFAKLSLNHYQALSTLEDIANEFDLDIYSKNSLWQV